MFSNKSTLTVRVDFPALDNLVAFLRESGQAEIDALTTQIGSLTQKLKQSSGALKQAVTDEQK